MEASINSKKFNRSIYPIPCLLNTISLSDNVLRYFILKDKYANVSGNLIDVENYGIPLFLARDIFSTCDLLQSNVQRIHARYSREGLATKVSLEDFRIDGITQNKMWFYSIQGLFEVIFHYHGRSVQEDCLKLLANLWLQHSKDKRLSEAISVKLEEESANILLSQQNLFSPSSVKDQAANNKSVAVQKSPDPGMMGKSSKKEVTPGCCKCNDKISDHDNHNTQMLENANRETSLNVCTQTDDGICAVLVHKLNVKPYHVYTQTDDVIISVIPVHKVNVKSYNVYTQTSVVPLHKINVKSNNMCTQTDDVITSVVPVDNIKIKTCHMEVQTDDMTNTFVTGEFYDSNNHDFSDMVTSQIEDQYNERECNDQTEDVTKCPYCLYLSRQCENQNTEFSTFLIKLNQFIMFVYSDTELEFLQTLSKLMSFFLDRYPVLVMPQCFLNKFLEDFHLDKTIIAESCKVKFLNFVCKWTGKELHKFGKGISQKVKIFMQNHIQCIDNLPPPENIIDEIFPLCMKQLILNWINPEYSDFLENSDNVDLYDKVDLSTKRCRLDNKPNFHVIQLILEFTNNALISGVAHVVYSRIQLANY